jgi:hypothetical protein
MTTRLVQTRKKLKVINAIHEFYEKHGYYPTIQDMPFDGYVATQRALLTNMEKDGLIQRTDDGPDTGRKNRIRWAPGWRMGGKINNSESE